MVIDSPNYTQVPNQLLGDILKGNILKVGMMADMGQAELRVFLTVCRLTFGYRQIERRASLTTIQKMTGLSRQGVLDGAADAEKRGIIERIQDGGVTLWRVLVKPVDQLPDELVKPVDQEKEEVVKPVDQQSQASRPPSKKETEKKPDKKETKGAAQKTPPVPADFLPDTETQLGILFPQNGRGIEGQLQAMNRVGWNDMGEDLRNATAHFLKASGLVIPNDKTTRTGWKKAIRPHVGDYGIPALARLYPEAVRYMQVKGLPISGPWSVTKTLAIVATEKSQGQGLTDLEPVKPAFLGD